MFTVDPTPPRPVHVHRDPPPTTEKSVGDLRTLRRHRNISRFRQESGTEVPLGYFPTGTEGVHAEGHNGPDVPLRSRPGPPVEHESPTSTPAFGPTVTDESSKSQLFCRPQSLDVLTPLESGVEKARPFYVSTDHSSSHNPSRFVGFDTLDDRVLLVTPAPVDMGERTDDHVRSRDLSVAVKTHRGNDDNGDLPLVADGDNVCSTTPDTSGLTHPQVPG